MIEHSPALPRPSDRHHRIDITRRTDASAAASGACGLIAAMRAAGALVGEAIGIVEPFWDACLGLPVPGIITQRFFQEADLVGTNDVILKLDTRLDELDVTRPS
jgi:multidrug efflux pump subunit AcrA (membrane-fusion protein)